MPKKIYGVNLGSWLLIEPWMIPREWAAMGGQTCDDCSKCIASEFEFAKAYPSLVDETMRGHWESFFNFEDVKTLSAAGINTVRIPLGYWIVEDLVDRNKEFYPRGGLQQLKRGLKQLRGAGIGAILDHHALPGVQTPQQMFTGRCTKDVKFYTQYNYHRALIWSAVMTAISHFDVDFWGVWAIEAVNEPIMDANKTPGYGDFQKNFVSVVRAVELAIEIKLEDIKLARPIPIMATFQQSLKAVADSGNFNAEVSSALKDALPMMEKMGFLPDVPFNRLLVQNDPLYTNFMDIGWQHNNPANPADAAIGPQIYDSHLYYSFGGVTDATEDAYLRHICNLDQRIANNAGLGNKPLYFGEWALSTQFEASDAFLRKWADAQKWAYGKAAGWMFWNYKMEEGSPYNRQWSYLKGLEKGFFTQNPAKFNDPHVCDPYRR